MLPHLMGFVLICITIGAHEHEFSQFFPKFWIALKYIFRHILLIISTCDLKLFRKLPIPMGNILWQVEDHSYSSTRAILLQSWHFDIRKNSILCIKRRLVSRYTGWPRNNGTVDTVDFSELCSNQQLFSLPSWKEHLFHIIITPRSSNLVENFLFYETLFMDCHYRDLHDFENFEARWQINGKSQKWQWIRNYS